MKYLIYSYVALNDEDDPCAMIVFEPIVIEGESDAKRNCAILKLLRHNEFYYTPYAEARSNFDNIFVDAYPCCSLE